MTEKIDLTVAGYDPYVQAGDCYFDIEAYLHVKQFFDKHVKHVKGEWAGKPFVLEPWQQKLIANLFGWKKPDGTRRYRTLFFYVPRKGGKSTLLAGCGVYMLGEDGEPGAEVIGAASKKDQAMMVYIHARGMVQKDKYLSDKYRIYKSPVSIVLKEDEASVYKLIAADDEGEHGASIHCGILDELHVQKNRDLYDVIDTSMGSRRSPLLLIATTADFDRPSICNEKHEYACNVRDNIIHDPSFLPVIYEASVEDDWHSEEVWKRANPNWGVSLKIDFFKSQYRKAVAEPGFENTFKRLHLNVRTEQAVRWLSMEHWKKCTKKVSEDDLLRTHCYGGLDLSSNKDLSAFALYFPEYKALKLWYWLPKDNINLFEKYSEWVRTKRIIATEGNVIDQRAIESKIAEINEQYRIIDIGFDAWDATNISIRLQEDHQIEMVKFPQNFGGLNEPSKAFESMIIDHTLVHNNDPVLLWMAANVAKKENENEQIRPTKKDSYGKIDGVVASIMAIGRALNSDDIGEEPQFEVY